MKPLAFSPAAEADVRGIWNFTADQWDEDQADRYIDEIHQACRDLASGRKRGQRVAIRQGYFKYRLVSHVIYFRVADETLVVMRILHFRMDAGQHLGG